MKTIILLIVLYFIGRANALDITCSVVSCNLSDNSKIANIQESPSFKQIETKDLTGESVNLSSYNTSGQVAARINGVVPYLTAWTTGNDTNPFEGSSIIGDLIENLNITSLGFNGTNGKNNSRLCAERFVSGAYGSDAYNYFIGRHVVNSSTACDSIDYNYLLNNKFNCSADYSPTLSPVQSIGIIDSKRSCQANLVRNKCVKKSYNISCKQRLIGLNCCDSNQSTWGYLTNIIMPKNFISSSIGATCVPSKCVSQYNGYEVTKNFVGSLEDKNNINFCKDKFTSRTLNATYSGGVTTASITLNSTVRNNVSLPLPTVKDSLGNTISSSDYNFFVTNVTSLNSAGLSIRNCMGLDGSAVNDYGCDIKPGPATTVKLKAIDKFGNISNELSISLNESIYVNSKRVNSFNCLVPGIFCQEVHVGSSYYYILSNGSTQGSLDTSCLGTDLVQPTNTIDYSPAGSTLSYQACSDFNYKSYSYKKAIFDKNGEYAVYQSAYTETTQTGIKIYAGFDGVFP